MIRAEVRDRRVVVALHLKMIVGHHHFVKALQSTTQGVLLVCPGAPLQLQHSPAQRHCCKCNFSIIPHVRLVGLS